MHARSTLDSAGAEYALISQDGQWRCSFCLAPGAENRFRDLRIGDTIGFEVDRSEGTVAIVVNGLQLVTFSGLPERLRHQPVYPMAAMCTRGAAVRLSQPTVYYRQ